MEQMGTEPANRHERRAADAFARRGMDDGDSHGLVQRRVVVLPDGWLDRKNAAAFLGRSPSTLADWHRLGKGPKSGMRGGRRFYHIDDLRAFGGVN